MPLAILRLARRPDALVAALPIFANRSETAPRNGVAGPAEALTKTPAADVTLLPIGLRRRRALAAVVRLPRLQGTSPRPAVVLADVAWPVTLTRPAMQVPLVLPAVRAAILLALFPSALLYAQTALGLRDNISILIDKGLQLP